MADGKPTPTPNDAGDDETVSPMEAQNAYQAHESVPGPKEGVLTGAEPSQAGRHDEEAAQRR